VLNIMANRNKVEDDFRIMKTNFVRAILE